MSSDSRQQDTKCPGRSMGAKITGKHSREQFSDLLLWGFSKNCGMKVAQPLSCMFLNFRT